MITKDATFRTRRFKASLELLPFEMGVDVRGAPLVDVELLSDDELEDEA